MAETLHATSHIVGDVANPNNAVGNTPSTWAGVVNSNTSATSRWAIGDPVDPLTPSAVQTVNVVMRKGSNFNNPSAVVNLYEDGVLHSTIVASTTITSTTGQTLSGTFNTADITDRTLVEISVTITGAGGSPSARNSAQISHIEWVADTSPAADPPNEGSASGAIGWAGSATGAVDHEGASSGAITWAGSADGATEHSGTGSGSVEWVGAASGQMPATVSEGEASGAITWAGIATGDATHEGGATGAVEWVGSADGASVYEGSATGTLSWDGSASGETPGVDTREGFADGTISWDGSATGTAAYEGAAVGSVVWAGSAEGITSRAGSAVGTITWAGSAHGGTGQRYRLNVMPGRLDTAWKAEPVGAAGPTARLDRRWIPGKLE